MKTLHVWQQDDVSACNLERMLFSIRLMMKWFEQTLLQWRVTPQVAWLHVLQTWCRRSSTSPPSPVSSTSCPSLRATQQASRCTPEACQRWGTATLLLEYTSFSLCWVPVILDISPFFLQLCNVCMAGWKVIEFDKGKVVAL